MSIITTCLTNAVKKSRIKKVCLVSDFLYQREIVDSLEFDTFHVTRGRPIAFGTGLKLANPELKVIALIGDLITLGGNHFMHAGRRNMDIVVICVNNFIYPKIAGNTTPTTKVPFSQYAPFERPINVPHMAKSSGAVYVARWTTLHNSELTESITQALQKSGFSVIEVMAPGGSYFAGIPSLKNESELLKFYYENSVIKNGEDTRNVEIIPDNKIIVGKFFEQERPTFLDSYNAQLSRVMGDKFKPYV